MFCLDGLFMHIRFKITIRALCLSWFRFILYSQEPFSNCLQRICSRFGLAQSKAVFAHMVGPLCITRQLCRQAQRRLNPTIYCDDSSDTYPMPKLLLFKSVNNKLPRLKPSSSSRSTPIYNNLYTSLVKKYQKSIETLQPT